MQVEINELTYVPTLFLRSAEMQALEHLSNAEKDAVIPLVLLKPWANSQSLDGGIKRIEKAYPSRRYMLDIDRYYTRSSERASWSQYLRTQSSDGDFKYWRDFVGNFENIIPAIQHVGATETQIQKQIEWTDEIGRPFFFRIENNHPGNRHAVLDAIRNIAHSNYLVVIDVGWSRDILSLEMWASSWIEALLELHRDLRVVISGSSFPADFMAYGRQGEEALQERPLFNSLARRHNAARLVYGAWASSRPQGAEGGGPGYPGVALPLPTKWVFFRGSAIGGSFQPLAQEAVNSGIWDNNLSVWGKYFINNTANDAGYVINSAQQATAARINIHMNEQISRGNTSVISDVPEDYVD